MGDSGHRLPWSGVHGVTVSSFAAPLAEGEALCIEDAADAAEDLDLVGIAVRRAALPRRRLAP
jgi:hypothetical protein